MESLVAALADRYRVERELGQGGMATVYLAHDIKHNRKVALKILRPELAAIIGAERFLKEIQVTANLQHPNILPLYDSGVAGWRESGTDAGRVPGRFLYYVMPFVEGETLRDKLHREKQLRVDAALEITKSVAAALDYAHRQGVVHRDIKPENILMHEGQALVADFGIALAVSQAGGTRLTETGLSLGTPHYMSPEQATGDRELDARSDVYSLGCVVYEMLVGEPPHLGNSVQAVVAKILTDDPQPAIVRRNTIPPHVNAAVQTALAKLPADRFAGAAQFAEALQNPAFTTALAGPAHRIPAAPGGPWKRLALGFGGTTAALAALLAWSALRPDPAPPASRQRVLLGPSAFGAVALGTAIAPDGSAIVFQDSIGASGRLWIKERDQLEPTPLVTPGADSPVGPFFSPDGTWVAFCDGKLRKVPRTGGVAITLSDTSTSVFCGAWLDDGTIVFPGINGERLYRVSGDGGTTETLSLTDSVQKVVFAVSPLPGSRGVLLQTVDTRNAQAIWALDLRDRTAHEVVAGATGAWYLPAVGGLLFARPDGSVLVAPFDLGSLTTSGPPIPVFAGVRTVQGLPELKVGGDGSLLYVAGLASATDGSGTPVWVTRDGRVTPIDTTWRVGIVFNGGLALSRDGRRVAVSSMDSAGRNDVFVRRLPSGVPSRFTFEGTTNIRPAWSPDGEQVLYVSDRDGVPNLWVRRADGSRQAQPIGRTDRPVWEGAWSPDMTWLLLRTDDVAAGRGDILGVRLGQDSTPVPFVATEAEETSPAFSPDGRWLAYSSAASGRKEVYVRPFPNVEDGMWQVSANGGTEPVWAHSGREIFYRNVRGRMEAASVSTRPTFEVGAQRELFDASAYWSNDDNRFYAVSPDDQRFLMLQPTPDTGVGGPGGWVLVENIIPELQAALRR